MSLAQLHWVPEENLRAHLHPGSASPLETHTVLFSPVSCCCIGPVQPGSGPQAPPPAGGGRHSKTSLSQAGLVFVLEPLSSHSPLAPSSHLPLLGQGRGKERCHEWVQTCYKQQGRQHHTMCSSPTAIFLAFHHGQHPTLSLVWVSPPHHRTKLKGVIKLVSPKTVQMPRARSHEWCVLHEAGGEVPGPSSRAILGQVPARGNARAMPGARVGKEKLDVVSSPSLAKAVQLQATLASFRAAAFIRVACSSLPLYFGVN